MDDADWAAHYATLLEDVKARVRSAQVRAASSANRELVLLYWSIGRDILARQASLGWGAKVIDRLAADLGRTFPTVKGFSPRNLKYMRAFAEAWPDEDFVQQAAARLPWFHNVAIIERVKDPEVRRFYLEGCIAHGWSRNLLTVQIDTRLHERQGRAATNFATTLPAPHADLAQQLTKDPYVFDFLTLGPERPVGGRPILHSLAPSFSTSSTSSSVSSARSRPRCGWPRPNAITASAERTTSGSSVSERSSSAWRVSASRPLR